MPLGPVRQPDELDAAVQGFYLAVYAESPAEFERLVWFFRDRQADGIADIPELPHIKPLGGLALKAGSGA